MYSVVIAVALSTSPATPNFGFGLFGGNNNCSGNCAGCQGQCYGCGGCCGGCSGCQGCNGCCGGSYGFLGFRDYFAGMFSGNCGGCCGGCNGCCGGCNGCCGGGCCGGGCYGSCYGGCMGMSMGCMGCGGGCYGGGMPISSYGGYSPGYGFDGMTGNPMMAGMTSPIMGGMGNVIMPNATTPLVTAPQTNETSTVPQAAHPAPEIQMPQAFQQQTPPNQATVIVSLPADARLFVEGRAMNLTGAIRQFRTTDLQTGATYTYAIKIEATRNGKAVDETKTVTVEPGKTTQVHFAEPGSAGATRS